LDWDMHRRASVNARVPQTPAPSQRAGVGDVAVCHTTGIPTKSGRRGLSRRACNSAIPPEPYPRSTQLDPCKADTASFANFWASRCWRPKLMEWKLKWPAGLSPLMCPSLQLSRICLANNVMSQRPSLSMHSQVLHPRSSPMLPSATVRMPWLQNSHIRT
jgi:hypothetical protein